tara:strand:- start:49 stop:1182 length:1134 start_codon:yes stop_codon:yes gene_type:complete
MEKLMTLQKYVRQIKTKEKFTEEKKLLVMGDTTAAFDMERVIVSAAGGEPFTSKLIPNSDDIGKKIITDLKLSGKGSFPKNTYPASKRWNAYFPSGAKGSTLTPKTDLIIGDKRISLKTGSAQLMSGGVNEASATFYISAEESGTSLNEAVSNLGKHINNLLPSTNMKKLGIKGNKTQLKQMGKFAEIEILKNADDAHHAFKNDMRKVFQSNAAFAEAFTFEAMTGKIKFDNSLGTADHFLVTDYEGKANIHKVTSMSDAYVKKIAKQVKPDVKFKASQSTSSQLKSPQNPKGKTGYYTFWSAVGLGVKMIVEEEMKTGDLLNEGFMDIFKRAINKALNWIKNFWNKVKKVVSKSWESLINFMGLEPMVSFNNYVKF